MQAILVVPKQLWLIPADSKAMVKWVSTCDDRAESWQAG